MEKTNYEVTKIQRQMAQVVTKNESFTDVFQYMRFKMKQDAQYHQPMTSTDDDMLLDKDIKKRNLQDILHDEDENLHSSYHDK
jgi:DNA-directed RNA polymerase sigma subunit (sigma70/sigma32)